MAKLTGEQSIRATALDLAMLCHPCLEYEGVETLHDVVEIAKKFELYIANGENLFEKRADDPHKFSLENIPTKDMN